MNCISFYRFILDNYIKEDSPIGDLARDIKGDKSFPKRCIDYSRIYSYLVGKGACNEAMEAFEECWKEYKAWRDQY